MIFDFNEGWTFEREGAEKRAVCLPHDAMLEERRYATCLNAEQSGYFPGGRYRYSKTFSLGEEDVRKVVTLRFGGVYRNAVISVNGTCVCTHRYGYSPFVVNVSDAVVAGENHVCVDVDNSLVPNCRWYSGSGIYRPVYLEITSPDAPSHLKITTVSYDPPVVEIDTDDDAEVALFDADGILVAHGKRGRFEIEDGRLWSAEDPYLYTCYVRRGGETRASTFGIRQLSWSGQTGLLVNGRETLLRGGCIHHDNGVLGACGFADAEKRRVKILKEQGFNAVRIAHNPASDALLEACDELGMYVLDEAFDGWYIPKDYHDFSRDFYDEYQEVLREMAERDYNHPSVIMYSVGNEVTESVQEKGIALCAEMRDILHRLDGTRPVTCGINVLLDVYAKLGVGVYQDKREYRPEPLEEGKGYRAKKTGSAFFNYWTEKLGKLFFIMSRGKLAEKAVCGIAPSLDIVGLNYASSRYDIDAAKYPDRLMLGTETMSGDLPYNWSRVLAHKQLIGDFVWAAWDYIGETCMGWTYPSYPGLPLLSGQGMIDITGLPLAQMAFLQTVWGIRKEPYIGVRPLNHSGETPSKGAWQFTNALESWTWHGFEGSETVVEVYSPSELVRLRLNGREVGTKRPKNNKALFKVRYEPGTLLAEALDQNGGLVATSELKTGGHERALSVRADRTTLLANHQDLCFAEIEFTDGQGALLPYVEQRVDIHVDGDAVTLQGFGSALTKSDEGFLESHHDTYRGRALAVFRAGDHAGKSIVTISSHNVRSVTLTLEVLDSNG